MNTYANTIEPLKHEIEAYKSEFANLANKIAGQSLLKDDLYFLSVTDRAIHLIDGFLLMLEHKNMTCVGALLRLQIDNCLRAYAPYIAQNKDDVFDTIIYEAKELRRLKDDSNQKMTDAQLVARLSEKYPGLKKTYEQCSGFIHLSDSAFYQIVTEIDEASISLSVGGELPPRYDDTLMSCAQAYLHFCKVLVDILNPVAESKRQLDDGASSV